LFLLEAVRTTIRLQYWHYISTLNIDYLAHFVQRHDSIGLSEILDGDISHGQVSIFCPKGCISKDLWKALKKDIRAIEDEWGVLIFDNTIQEKSFSLENDLICWHFDQTVNRSVKGINLLNLESAVERPVECVGFCDWRGAMRTRPWMAEGRTPTVGALGDAGAVVE